MRRGLLLFAFCKIVARQITQSVTCGRVPFRLEMFMRFWSVHLLGIILLSSLAAFPQAASKPNNGNGNNTDVAANADPLGRSTPAGTVFGFLQACQSSNYKTAAHYLHLSPSRRQSQGQELASELKSLIDSSGGNVSLKRISTRAEGDPQEGVPLDRQNLGTLVAGDREVPLTLERVYDPSVGGRIWLFADETLARVPDVYEQFEGHQIEGKLPKWSVERQLFGIAVWQWLGLLLSVPLAALIALLVVKVFQIPRLLWLKRKGLAPGERWSETSSPLWLLLATLIDRILVAFLSIPLLQRHYYAQVTWIVFVSAFFWFLWRLTVRSMRHLRTRAISTGRTGTGSLMILGERILKVLIIIGAVISVLGVLGFNLTTALAGLGIGGIAIAFAAQKTLENLFGGVSVLGDEVLRVGDTCQFGDRVGTVEDISLRSTRIRTVERTELSIPNGALATMNVENLTRRDKILFKTTLGLRTETSADQLRYVLAEVRRMLYEHPKVETSSARIRLIGIGQSSLDLEAFAFILTQDFGEFAGIREDLLFRIMGIVDQAGSGFAFPSRTVYLGRDPGIDDQKAEAAVQKVEKWRDEKQLPFPDFTAPEISSFRGSIEYPPADSALGNGRKTG